MLPDLGTRIAAVAIWKTGLCSLQCSVLGRNSAFLMVIEHTERCAQITLMCYGLTAVLVCKMCWLRILCGIEHHLLHCLEIGFSI